jgi:hypothetical protein
LLNANRKFKKGKYQPNLTSGLKRGDPIAISKLMLPHAVWSSVIEPEIDFERSLIVLQAARGCCSVATVACSPGHKAFSGRRENEGFG